MEIYKNLSDPASQEFEKLLNSQLSKVKVQEGKIIEGKINKITDKFVFLYIENMKSEPVLDINELKSMGLADKIKIDGTIEVLLEHLEDRKGEVVVSASKAMKIKGWERLVEHYEKNEQINGKIIASCKGGAICEHIETGSLMFLPGSQISDRPLKNISHLIGEVQKFAIIKLDRQRGNCCVSRKEVLSSFKKEDKAKLINAYKEGDIIKSAECKSLNSFGAFLTVNGELDVLCHLQEASYSRINHPDEVFEVGKKYDVVIISIDTVKLQIGVSRKKIFPDPFDDIDSFEQGKKYEVTVDKLTDFGAFCSLKPGLTTLLHNSELSFTKKNVSAKKMFKVGEKIECVITDINKSSRRIALSYRLTKDNPFEVFEKRFPINSVCEGTVVSKNEYSLFIQIEDLECDCFCHANDLTFYDNGEEELAKYKKGSKIQVKVLEIKIPEQKIRVSHRATKSDPFDYFTDKEVGSEITVKIVSTDNKKGLTVRPENCEMDFIIKKSQIAIDAADSRVSRFTGGERIDCAIADLSMETRKVTLSIKFLEEKLRKTALEKYGSEVGSGKQLPFSSLSEDLKKKSKDKEKDKDK